LREAYSALGLVRAMEIPQKKIHRLVSTFPNVVEVNEMVIKNTDAEAIVARERKLKNQRAYYATNKEQIWERCRKGQTPIIRINIIIFGRMSGSAG
jgi:hypothetical protein